MGSNIKQKVLNFINSFICLFFILSCSQTKTFSKSKKIPDIAILLPITGSNAAHAKEYMRMIKIGLSDGLKIPIRLRTYDSATETKLTSSLNKIIDNKTDIVIGPMYSESTKISAQKLLDQNIVLISLSNNPLPVNNNVYIYGHAPMQQLKNIIDYALCSGYKNYILLLPAGKRSFNTAKVLNDMIIDKKGYVSMVEFYGGTPENINRSVCIISDAVDNLNENDLNLQQPVILICDQANALKILYKNIKSLQLDKRALIAGDNRADITHISPIKVMFTGSMNIIYTDLIKRTLDLEIKHISFMHAISYDVGKMVGHYIGIAYDKEKFISNMNNANKEFIGISGNISFHNHVAKRKYHILEKEGMYCKQIQD